MNELKPALKEQYHAGLAMLNQCVANCPDDLWTSPSPRHDEGNRVIFRSFWRIAFHAVYFTHLYLGQNEDSFAPWPGRRVGYFEELWRKPWDIEPFEFPENAKATSKAEVLEYIAYVDALVSPTVDSLDLAAGETGFPWYRQMNKLSHQLMNLRHLQGHVGQLSELLVAREIDIDWVSRA